MINPLKNSNDQFYVVEIGDESVSTDPNTENVIKHIAESVELLPKEEKKQMNNKGSLCELFCSEYFSMELLMVYLTEKNDIGIIDYLSNLLFEKRFDEKTLFYLPQLCALIRGKEYYQPFLRYIINKSCDNPLFAVTTSWIIDSYIDDLKGESKKFEKIIEEIETKLINGTKIKDIDSIKNNQKFIEKTQKLDHFDKALELYSKLKKMCERLKAVSINNANSNGDKKSKGSTKSDTKVTIKELRKDLLIKTLNKFNKNLDIMIQAHLKFPTSFLGYLLPFTTVGNRVIVKFHPEYSFCFSTKARVPVKLTVECVDITEGKQIVDSIENGNTIHNENIRYKEEENEKRLDENNEENQKKAKQILESVKYQNEHPNEENNDNHLESNRANTIENIIDISNLKNPFGDEWNKTVNEIKAKSRFRNFSSLSIMNFIAKANDDLRQEHMTMQLIKKFDEIFKKAGLPLKLRPYEIVITSSQSGLIEFLPDTLSIDGIKHFLLPYKIPFDKFFKEFFKSNYISAQKNFVESLAAYSIVSYLIAIKDRHNGNILLDRNGSIIHIDFGFILGISPGGNLNFENAPFKLTKDYIRIMEGVNSEIFAYYKSLIVRGILEARKHIEGLATIVKAMGRGVPMPCFNAGTDVDTVVENFKERFLLKYTEDKAISIIEGLIEKAANSWRTTQYDIFQKLTNDIIP